MKDLTKLYLIQAEYCNSSRLYYIGEHNNKDYKWYKHTFMEKFYKRDINDKFEHFYTLEEATRIMNKYRRYAPKNDWWYPSKIYLTRASKLKHKFKKVY